MPMSEYETPPFPGRIGSLELRNRIIVTAMGVNLGDEDGHFGDRIIAYHEEQARGGAGLIISGACGVMYPVGQVQPWQIAVSDDVHVPGLKRAVDAAHRHGACFAVQLHQGGLNAVDDTRAGRPLWCPSEPEWAAGDFVDGFLPSELEAFAGGGRPSFKVLSHEDITELVAAFAAGAARAQAAGCDAVEVHGGHGYVPSSFLSPKSNRRTDEYGGPLENRARLLLEIVRAVRAAVGETFPVIVKIDSREVGKEGGISLDDATTTAHWLEEAGADAITVSAYHDTAQGKMHSASNIPHEPNWNLPAAAAIKQRLSIPIIACGRVEPGHASAEIAAGRFDFLAMGRKLLADPHLPRKLAEGQIDEIRPCVYCYTCVSAIYTRESTRCAVNPECGLEYTPDVGGLDREPQARGRRRWRPGRHGGGAAARRGRPPGHALRAERPARRNPALRVVGLSRERGAAGLVAAQGRSGRRRDPPRHLRHGRGPDRSRARPRGRRHGLRGKRHRHPRDGAGPRPHRRGHAGPHVRWELRPPAREDLAAHPSGDPGRRGHRAHDSAGFRAKATRTWMPFGRDVAILGGGLVGLELAEFLSERGRTVHVVDEVPRFGAGLTLVRRLRLLAELREHGVGLHQGAKDIRIEEDRVRFTDANGDRPVDPGHRRHRGEGHRWRQRPGGRLPCRRLRVHEVGDGTGVGYIEGAMRDAMEAVDAIDAG